MLEGHHEMADGHQRGAEDDGAAPAEHAVGQQAAEDRREINEAGVEAVDLRGEGLRRQRPEHGFQGVPERDEADHRAGALRLEQIFDHVEHEQRAHPVIGEALPHLGREQKSEAARMAEKVGCRRRIADTGKGGCGHPGSAGSLLGQG